MGWNVAGESIGRGGKERAGEGRGRNGDDGRYDRMIKSYGRMA